MEKILSALGALGVEQYIVTEKHTDSLECFYVKKNLDLTRRADTAVTTVRVFRPFEQDRQRMLGDSEATVRPGMSEAEVRRAVERAWYAAGSVANPWYPLPAGIKEPPRPDGGGFAGKSLDESMKQMTQALFAADRAGDVFLNSAEVFMRRTRTHIVTSAGADVAWEKADVWGEYVCQCPAPVDVETYHQFNYRDPDTASLTADAAHALEMTKARARASAAPVTGTYALVLDREQMRVLLGYYVDRAGAGMIYQKYSPFRLGENVQGEAISGDKLTVSLAATEPYTDFGAPMADRPLLEAGVLRTIHGGPRFAHYLGVEPTGQYRAIRVDAGAAPLETLTAQPCLHAVSFSDFQMDPLSGHFGGELRLGFLHENGQVIPVTGGSVNGSILDCQGNMTFSAERYRSASYDGPLAVRLEGVSVAGR